MPVCRVEDNNLGAELAQEFENELPQRVENELVQQVVDRVLQDRINSSMPRKDSSEIGELLQNNLGRKPLSSAFANFASALATLRLTTVTKSSVHVPIVTTSVSARPVQTGVFDVVVLTAPRSKRCSSFLGIKIYRVCDLYQQTH